MQTVFYWGDDMAYYYQDLEELGQDEEKRKDFVTSAVSAHRASPKYKIALYAESYYAKHNLTIERFRKMLYTFSGKAYPDLFSANYKLSTLFFRRFVLQQVQFVLSNGVSFENSETAQTLGDSFENALQTLAKKAMVDGVAFGYWNANHLEVFSFTETQTDAGFAPLWDKDDGTLKAGVRFWRIGDVCRYTLYETDGFTEYKQEVGKEMQIKKQKRKYKLTVERTQADGETVTGGENYGGVLPIIPIYANDLHDSEFVGIREDIDCYDFIKSGLANDIDDASGFYWVLKNTGGMDDVDLAKFLDRLRVVKAAVLDGDSGMDAEAHTLDVPYQAREAMLVRLRNDLYEDFGLLDTDKIMSGNLTATAIRMGYQTQEDKCGDFEWHIRSFIFQLFGLLGIEDSPTFTWNRIANQLEETQMVLTAANYLDDEAILRHLPWLSTEEVDGILARRDAENLTRFDVTEGAENAV